MKRYDSYKDSGVKWIGEIPSHWKRCRNKDIMRERKDIVGDKANKYTLLSLTMNGVIIRDISEGKGKFPKDFTTYKIVRPGQMVFCLFDIEETPRTVGLVKNEGMLTGAYDVFDLHNVNGHYLYYYYESIDDRKALKPLYRGLRKTIPTPTFMSMSVYLPPLPEQRAIVSFLDTELGKIDTYMDKEQQLIERLKELKQSLIARAVTHGINPNVKMKPSGIDWIGEIPEHWKLLRAKNMFQRMNRPVRPEDETITCFRDGQVTLRKRRRLEGFTESFKEIGYQGIRKGDLVIHQMDAFAGSIGVSDSDGKGTPVYICLQPKGSENNFYYAYLLREMARTGYIKSLYRGIRERSSDFRFETLAKLFLPIPPASEQRAIVDYLQDKTSKIDKLISEKTRELEYMKELRQRIISDAVTGKIDVRS